jgi:hypothetical protein
VVRRGFTGEAYSNVIGGWAEQIMREGGDRARAPPSSFHAWAAVILLPFPLVARTPLRDGPLAYMEPKKPLVAGVQRVERVPG